MNNEIHYLDIKELRPGNVIRWGNDIVTVTVVDAKKNEVSYTKADGKEGTDIIQAFEGVELTEDLLIKNGFVSKRDAMSLYYVYNDDFILEAHAKGFWLAIIYDEVALMSTGEPIHKIHTLQNLYFDLNNHKELIFNGN